jgi:molybdate transport system substrate-binding protein
LRFLFKVGYDIFYCIYRKTRTMRRFAIAAIMLAPLSANARADDLVIYGAGSLRESLGQIAKEFGLAHGLGVTTQFGPSGRMRERIEKGDRVDLFASADIGHARKLVDDGRASVMAVFARNTVCLLSPAKFGATSETALDKLLAPGVRIGISPPKVDPLGDYTMRLFDVAERMRPGSAASLRARSVIVDTPPGTAPPKSGNADVDAIQDGRVDVNIVYCSGRGLYARMLPDAAVVPFPSELQVGPEYGLAVLKDAQPAALLLALTILSPDGQKVMAQHGFKPVTLPND